MADWHRGVAYPGSRQKRTRYTREGDAGSVFIELTPEASEGPEPQVIERFHQSLTAVTGVDKVTLHPKGSKHAQGNPGNHYQTQTFAIYSSKMPAVCMEFELTRNRYTASGPFTVSVVYKNPTQSLIREAWRILCVACRGKELLPDLVDDMEKKC